jgi:hypothetical protein
VCVIRKHHSISDLEVSLCSNVDKTYEGKIKEYVNLAPEIKDMWRLEDASCNIGNRHNATYIN